MAPINACELEIAVAENPLSFDAHRLETPANTAYTLGLYF